MTKRIYKVKVLSFKNEDIVAGLAHEPPSGVESFYKKCCVCFF